MPWNVTRCCLALLTPLMCACEGGTLEVTAGSVAHADTVVLGEPESPPAPSDSAPQPDVLEPEVVEDVSEVELSDAAEADVELGALDTDSLDEVEDAGPDDRSVYDKAGDLFGLDVIHQVNLTLDDAAMTALTDHPDQWVSAELTVNGESPLTVNVRLDAIPSVERTLEEKAAFELDIDALDPTQRLVGMSHLHLHNMVQDNAMISAFLAHEQFRQASVPAPRVGYASVVVNEAPFGLYALLESPASVHFLEHFFGDVNGLLVRGYNNQDLYLDGIERFEVVQGEDDALLMGELVERLDQHPSTEPLADALEEWVELESYLAMSAGELIMGHRDGYAPDRKRFWMYRPQTTEKWSWIPWGLDRAFNQHLSIYGGQGRLQQMCVASLSCRERLGEALLAFRDQLAGAGLGQRALAAHDAIRQAALDDPRKEATNAEMTTRVGQIVSFSLERPLTADVELACLDPEYGDQDGDGFSACFGQDCDDTNPDIFPGAEEICGNFIDDNCDGAIDDGEECPECPVVSQDPVEGDVLLCRTKQNWEDAYAVCIDQGGDMVSVHSTEQHEALSSVAYTYVSGHVWLGLSDLETEGQFVWTDGTPLDFEFWQSNEPNNSGNNEHCGHFYESPPHYWNDLPCNNKVHFLCRLPPM